MKKVYVVELLLVLLLVGVMTLLLHQKPPRADVTSAEVVTLVESIADKSTVSLAGTLRLRRAFGLNSADYDLVVYYMPASALNVEEFLLIRADESQLDAVQAAMEARITSQVAAFNHYGEKQTELLNKAVVYRIGNYLCLIVSEDPGEWLSAVKALLEV
ncbi:MAG: DUF4358 domain-containing protein [Lachnospiraceae bacterium]|nr:DUF4358 domain-containing protein [Lachnospiraceae bacterium]